MIKKLSLLIVSVSVTLIAAEIMLRLLGEETHQIVKDDSDFIVYDSAVGYTYTKNLNVIIRNKNYTINIKTNSHGYRDDEWIISPGTQNILVAGESFCAGYGVRKHYRWSDLLAEKLDAEKKSLNYIVFNASVSGYNLNQIKKTADNLNDIINPAVIIIGLNVESLDRLSDPYVYFQGYCIRKTKLNYAKVYDGELYIHNFSNEHIQYFEKYLLQYSVLYNFFVERIRLFKSNFVSNSSTYNPAELIKVKSILSKIKNENKSGRVKIIVLPIIQHNSDYEFTSSSVLAYNSIKSFCYQQKIFFIDLLPVFKEKLKREKSFWVNNDPHWNENAHSIAAEVIYNQCKNESLLQTVNTN